MLRVNLIEFFALLDHAFKVTGSDFSGNRAIDELYNLRDDLFLTHAFFGDERGVSRNSLYIAVLRSFFDFTDVSGVDK